MEVFTDTATPKIKGENKTVQHSISEVHGHASDSGQSSEENVVTTVQPVAARRVEDNEKKDRYWKEAFEGHEAVHFPTLPKSLKQIVADTTIQRLLLPIDGTVHEISISTLVRAAWGLVASGMAGTEDVTFGVAVPLKDTAVADQDGRTRPATLVPMRIETAGNQKVVDYLQTVEDNGAEIVRSCHPRLDDIAALSRHCRQACNFQSLLVTEQNKTSTSTGHAGDAGPHVDISEWTSKYGLILALYQASHEAAVQATFDANVIEPWIVTNLLQQIAHVVNQLSRAGAETQLGGISKVTAPDLQQIWEWNAAAAIPAEESIHDIVGQMALTRPNATAIHSWDGDLTYGEMDALSTDLAKRLVRQGVRAGCFVLLCFEKSKWATVSMLAMSKTGGAFVLLDPSLPLQRLKSISRQVNATMVLSSGANHPLASQLCEKVLEVSHELFEETPTDATTSLPDVDLDSVIYAVFTSGTTGTPKGALIHHRSSASAVLHQTQAFGYTPETRVYDFSTYSFDGSVLNAFTVFAAGGCLCVPTDEGRKSMLVESMESLTANTVFLTPSVAELLTPEQVPHLTSMIIGGEAVRVNDIQPWWDAPGVNVFTIYGPSECTPVSMVNPNPSTPEEAIRLGWGAGQVTWVVDPEDHDILVPLGCVGELLLEGPLVGAGYLGEPEKTASVFIESPSWLIKGGPSDQPGRTSRLYKTGDLVRYNSDGSLTFVDRKDTQVKIRGQRVELGEVEFFFYEHTGAREAVAEVIRPGGVEDNATLVVYLSLDEDTHIGDSAVQQSVSMDELGRVGLLLDLGELGQKMSQSLPRYMIPSACFCVSQRLPRTPSGKMNRKLLREIGSRISPQQLAHLQVSGGAEKRQPETAIESQLQALWAKNLGITADSIGLDDSFFQLGGNSIGAMRLVNQARTEGLHFSVSTIFQTPTLGDLASKVKVLPHSQDADANDGPPPPFSLLQMSAQEAEAMRREFAARYKIETAIIEDIYPCTPLQQGILSISARGEAGSNEYVYRGVLEIAPNVDMERLQKAWQDAARAMPIVRTRIVQHKDLGLVQMVLDKDLPWKHADDLEAYIALDKSDPMGLGDALCRFAVVHQDAGVRKLVWTLHHAIYDGWSLSMIEDTVSRLYNSTDLVVRPGFNTFIQYLEKADSAKATDYWRSYFVDGDFIAFPAVPSSMQGVPIVADSVIERQCSLLPRPSHDMTVSTLIRAALSIVLGQYTGSEDVVFGCTVWGRNAPVAGVGDINGPTFATVPIRAQISGADTLSKFLGTLQRDAIKMIDHEQTGLSKIAASSDDARSACDFQTLLVIQTEDEPSASPFGTWRTVSGWEAFSTYALTLNCFLQENEESVIIKAAFDGRVVEAWKVDQVLSQLNLVISQLLTASPDKTVGGLQSLTPEDTALIQRLNGFDPPVREQCLHDIISEHARTRPHAPALDATGEDGLDYEEMDDLSDRLAQHLYQLGVRREMVVPLCFEKSMWTIVTVLGVQKAGGAFVLLDPTSPASRLQMLCRKVSATISVTSAQNEGKLDHCTDTSVVVSREHLYKMPPMSSPIPERPLPTNAAYCIFTSGSTGEPKACKVDHRAFASAGTDQSRRVGITKHTRSFQYGSYSFAGCIQETFLTLIGGGCLCVPTEDERLDQLAEVINKLRVDWAFLTATVLAMLSPEMVPMLKTICIGGEPVRSDQIKQWTSRINLRQTYGSSESSTYISTELLDQKSSTGHVGQPTSGRYWIVDQSDIHRLAPVGAPGDLLIEGPSVGREYVGDPEKTAAAFISTPAWRPAMLDKTPFRFLRTGDLAQYRKDGSIELIGRKDMQVKLYGQRIELGEIEHQIRLASPRVKEVVVELVTGFQGDKNRAALVGFIVLDSGPGDLVGQDADEVLQLIQKTLESVLPRYMVPSMLLPLTELPKTTTGKTNRKRLREMGLQTSAQEASKAKSAGKSKKQPKTEMERRLREMWATALAVTPESIGIEDNFFRLGGDSISVMRFVSQARDNGIMCSVSTAFKHPQLEALARVIENERVVAKDTDGRVAAFSLVGNEAKLQSIYQELQKEYGINKSVIEDVYPCTPLQEGLMSLTSKRAGDYIYQGTLKIGDDVNISRFKAAWEIAVREMPIMRTRIVEHSELGLLQVVLDQELEWNLQSDVNSYLAENEKASMGLGDPLYRLALIGSGTGSKPEYLVWTLHHALYDGWSFPMIEDTVQRIYDERPLIPRQPFNVFVSYVLEVGRSEEAAAYWRSCFDGAEFAPFPALPAGIREPVADTVVHQQYDRSKFAQAGGITMSTIVRAALAIALGRHSSSDDVIFGTTVWGRSAPVDGLEGINGPTFVTVPMRAKIESSIPVAQFLETMQQAGTDMMPYEHMGLQGIAKLSEDARRAAEFQTLLIINPEGSDMESTSAFGKWETVSGVEAFSTYAVTLNCSLGDQSIKIDAGFDSRIIDSWSVRQLMDQLDQNISQLVALAGSSGSTIADIDGLSAMDKSLLATWNKELPYPREELVHESIAIMAKNDPDATAISGWDGELSYSQLDASSTALAKCLYTHPQFTPNTIVPLCFEKSIYTIVAIYAVLKAGAAFVLLDPSQPEPRLRNIMGKVDGRLVITSAANEALSKRLSEHTLTVSAQTVKELIDSDVTLPKAEPDSLLYVCFTSGSTGTPKGAMVSHSSFSSAVHYQSDLLGLGKGSRMFDFVSYTFDVSIYNMLATLLVGGCVCVPSEQDRLGGELTGAINATRASIVTLTPSVARLIDTEQIQHLKTVVLLGEAVSSSDVERWQNRSIRVVNAYGPAETSVLATVNPEIQDAKFAHDIGRGAGALTWVVDPNDHNKLVSLGQVGELVIDGPIVGPGYVGEREKTDEVFIQGPSWLQTVVASTSLDRRMYKTGDLVRYREDGSLLFAGRKDSQIKIRGQRVELGEVEYHLSASCADALEAVAHVIRPQNSPESVSLVAFINLRDGTEGQYVVQNRPIPSDSPEVGLSLIANYQGIQKALSRSLPRYMIPAIFFSVREMPRTSSGKTDRVRLGKLASALSAHELAELQTHRPDKRDPVTDRERVMRRIWAGVLHLEESQIGLDDTFFELGGDSISAMRLVSQAKASGIKLSMAAIFDQPELEAVARNSVAIGDDGCNTTAPFSLLSPEADIYKLRLRVARDCDIEATDIEDMYPCTPLQEGLLSATSRRQDQYVYRSTLRLHDNVDVDRLRAAWEKTISSSPILRTRVVNDSHAGLIQVVVREQVINWRTGTDLAEALARDQAEPLGLGNRLCRLAIVDSGSSKFIVWTIHHCLYDGWSFPMIEETVRRYYDEQPPVTRQDFKAFVSYLQKIPSVDALSYWQSYLEEGEFIPFPALPPGVQDPVPNMIAQKTCTMKTKVSTGTTTSTLVRGALAIILGRYTSSPDVVFGSTVWGRDVPVSGIEEMNGPTFTTVPVRIRMPDSQQLLSNFLQGIQRQVVAMVDYQHIGLHNISKASKSAQDACRFQTLLVVQQRDEDEPESSLGTWTTSSGSEAFSNFALTLNCYIGKDGITMEAGFDIRVIDNWRIGRLLDQFCHVFTQLLDRSADRQSKLEDLDLITPADHQTLSLWNANVPATVERCLHHLITEHSKLRPHSTAISSWDGDITYGEIDALSETLARNLLDAGVGAEVIVPLLFEKSKWTAVTVLAVLKAGGAFVLLDPSQPDERLRTIMDTCSSTMVCTSIGLEDRGRSLASRVIVIGEDCQALNPEKIAHPLMALPASDPSSAAYACFTSGSTGTPKGSVMTHTNFASATHHQLSALRFDENTRSFDFASHGFDMAVHNVLATLIAGGCICVPSEKDRYEDLVGALNTSRSTVAILTPSVARLLEPKEITHLDTILLMGEPISHHDIGRWTGTRVHVMLGYGPSECSCFSNINTNGLEPSNLGMPVGLLSWVVSPDDHNQLVPVGQPGELVLEGPLVGRGYLKDQEKTDAAWIQDPTWLLEGAPGRPARRGRVYKSGDIVRYNLDGSLCFVERKDTQVKIRGQRVELGEVQYHVQECLPAASEVLAEIITPGGERDNSTLAVFLAVGDDESTLETVEKSAELFYNGWGMKVVANPAQINSLLERRVPRYMVPAIYFILDRIPRTPNGKLNRRGLRELASSLSPEQIAEMQTADRGEKRMPQTMIEKQLRDVWARVLSLDASLIGLDDSFFQLGGDSIGAMRLVSQAREAGLELSIANIFGLPQLQLMAEATTVSVANKVVEIIPEFSLLGKNASELEVLRNDLHTRYGIAPDTVEDIYPCTALQEGLLSITALRDGDYVYRGVLDIADDIEIDNMKSAWETTVKASPILRTRIVQHGSQLLQAVLQEDVDWLSADDLDTYLNQDKMMPMGLGQPLMRLAIITSPMDRSRNLVWTLHHALYDGISFPMIENSVKRAYQGNSLPNRPEFKSFIAHLQAAGSRTEEFWRSYLGGGRFHPFPEPPSDNHEPGTTITVEQTYKAPDKKGKSDVGINNITDATIIRSALGVVLGRYQSSADVVFGMTVWGRSVPVVGVEDINGPTFATVKHLPPSLFLASK